MASKIKRKLRGLRMPMTHSNTNGSFHEQCVQNVKKYLALEECRLRGVEHDSEQRQAMVAQWKHRVLVAPKQEDFSSCGIFVGATAEHIVNGLQPTFTQAQIPQLRLAITGRLLEIAHGDHER
eukprot:scaffold1786_cov398-Prasinococcus_capsulatus_cf.AAC.12